MCCNRSIRWLKPKRRKQKIFFTYAAAEFHTTTNKQSTNKDASVLGGEKKRNYNPKKKKTKTKTAIFLLHQSIKEGSNQNHKNKKKESRTPKHITLNNPRLEIHKPQFKETTTTTTAKLADTNQEKSFQDTNPKGKTTKNTTTM
jgi:hypothetical protein